MMRASSARGPDERGSAAVEFSLIMVILIPLFMGILQVGFFLHARNTIAACAHEGARVGANVDRGPNHADAATRDCIGGALGAGWTGGTRAREEGPDMVVTVAARMPAFAQWGPRFDFQVTGRAVLEVDPR